jgi:hypothetical protein
MWLRRLCLLSRPDAKALADCKPGSVALNALK